MEEESKKIVSLPYHQAAFIHLQKLFGDETRYRLTHKYAEFRRELFLSEFKPGAPIDSQAAWEYAREALEIFDAKMGEILSRRSAAYWLHIYRRIGVLLSPHHEDKIDPITTGLVRQIVELAIQKHGKLESIREFGNSMHISPNLILGGWMKKGLKALGGKHGGGEVLFRKYSKILQAQPTLVLREFGKSDFIGIYEVEGAAYQYWRLSALLRSLGKGASIRMDARGDWHYIPNMDLERLIVSVDERNGSANDFSSLLGVWVDDEILMGPRESEDLGTVFFPIYNVRRVDLGGMKLYGAELPTGSITNFFPYYFHVGRFLAIHSFMEKEFKKRRGYDFRAFLDVLAGLSSFSVLPQKALYANKEGLVQDIQLRAFVQTLSRGYHVVVGSPEDLCRMLQERIELALNRSYSIDQLRQVVASISLKSDKQSQISPWSGGPRAVIIPGDNTQIVDFVSIPAVLQTLFVFMPDRLGESGTVFEKLFRDALERRGYCVTSGELVSGDGKRREMDAGVQIGGCLYLFECVSVERPLDIEIGKPRAIQLRIERLAAKLEQVRALKEFLRKNPVGRNYDFSSADQIEHLVVSPFVEWVWSVSPELWSEAGYPRFVSPDEVFSLLESAKESLVRPIAAEQNWPG